MFGAILLIDKPNCKEAEKLDASYIALINKADNKYLSEKGGFNAKLTFVSDQCNEIDSLIFVITIFHGLMIFVCAFRELNEANTSAIGSALRLAEVMFSFAYISITLLTMRYSFGWFGLVFYKIS